MPSRRASHYYPFLRRLALLAAADDEDSDAGEDVADAFFLVNSILRPLLRPERLTIPNARLDISGMSDADTDFFFRFKYEEIMKLTDELGIPGTVIAPDGWCHLCARGLV